MGIRSRVFLCAAGLATAIIIPLNMMAAEGAETTVVAKVSADTYSASTNNTSHGNYTTLGMSSGSGGNRRIYLNFKVNKPSSTAVLTQAYLWMLPLTSGSDAEVYQTSAFNESTLIDTNKPALGAKLGEAGAFRAATKPMGFDDIYGIDLGRNVNLSSTSVNLAVETRGGYAEFASREGTPGPVLILKFASQTGSTNTTVPHTVPTTATTKPTSTTSTTKKTSPTVTIAPPATVPSSGSSCTKGLKGDGMSLVASKSTDFDGTSIPSGWKVNPDGSPGRQQGKYVNSNVTVSGGKLHIRSALDSGQYTSGELQSANTYSNGRIEVCAKLPASQKGQWPAIWMTNQPTNGWGSCDGANKSGELDMVEWWWDEHGSTVDRNQATTWTCTNSGWKHPSDDCRISIQSTSQGGCGLPVESDLTKSFHVWGMTWNDKEVVYDLDGVVYGTRTPSNTNTSNNWANTMNQNWKMRLETQIVPTNDNGWSKPDSSFKPVDFQVDFVHFYQ